MQERKVKAGDIVRLKSGGPAMSVQLVANDDSMAYCTWFERETLKTGAFNLRSLQPVPESSQPTAEAN